MMPSTPSQPGGASRRDLLTGRAVRSAVERAGDVIADQVVDRRAAIVAGPTVRLETKAMGCPWNVIMNPGPPEQVMIASDAFAVVHDLENQLTVYRDDSDVARLNANAAESPQIVQHDLYAFLKWTRALSDTTDGAFDSASGALIRLWRDCRLSDRIPTPNEIAGALKCSGIRNITFDDTSRTIRFPRPGFGFDLGAVGKGHGVDQLAARLRENGMSDFLVHGGYSSVFAAGDHVGQGGWPVSLKNPLFLDDSYATVLLSNRALGTSGSNVQYFRHEGRRYGHILDPRTGWPAEGLLSVTVLAATAAEADAYSTALYVMGLEKAIRWCQDHPDVWAILVPPADSAGRLSPVICNLPEELVFFEEDSRGAAG